MEEVEDILQMIKVGEIPPTARKYCDDQWVCVELRRGYRPLGDALCLLQAQPKHDEVWGIQRFVSLIQSLEYRSDRLGIPLVIISARRQFGHQLQSRGYEPTEELPLEAQQTWVRQPGASKNLESDE